MRFEVELIVVTVVQVTLASGVKSSEQRAHNREGSQAEELCFVFLSCCVTSG